MADRKLTFTLQFLAQAAGLADASELLDEMGDSLDDNASAGKKLAAAIEAAAANMQAELERTVAAADRLGQAMGPELTAKLDPTEAVASLQRMGLTLEDIEADAESLGQAMRRMDDASTTAIRKVGDEVDRTRSVTANFVGNAVQEIPGLTGAFGPLNVAAGQFAEYAAEGGIKLSSLAMVAGPLAGVGVVLGAINSHLENVARSKAFHAERVKLFVQLLRDGAEAADVLEKALEKKNPLEWDRDGKTKDLTLDLYRAGVTFEELNAHVNDSEMEFRLWAQTLFASANGAEDLNHVLNWQMQAKEDIAKATEAAAAQEFVFGDALDSSNSKAETTTRTLGSMAERSRSLAEALTAARRRYELLIDEIDDRDSWNNLILTLSDLGDELAAIDEEERTGAISSAEASAKRGLAIDEAKRKVIEYGVEVLGLPAEFVTEIAANVTGAQADLDTIIWRLAWIKNAQANIDWGTSGSSQTPGGSGPDGERNTRTGSATSGLSRGAPADGGGDVTVNLMLNDQTIQAITVRQEQLKRGRR